MVALVCLANVAIAYGPSTWGWQEGGGIITAYEGGTISGANFLYVQCTGYNLTGDYISLWNLVSDYDNAIPLVPYANGWYTFSTNSNDNQMATARFQNASTGYLGGDQLGNICGSNQIVIQDFAPSVGPLAQYKSDATTTIGAGGITTETTLVFSGLLNATNTSSTLQLQIEIQPSSTPFSNIPNVTSSASVLPGKIATTTYYGIVPREVGSNGQFHWQARTIDNTGITSTWQIFGPNATGTDFIINTIPLYTQNTSTYPSLSATTGTAWWAPQHLDNIATNSIAGFGCAITSVVMDLRSMGITTASSSHASSTDVNPGNINDWLENYNNTSTGPGYAPGGLLNWLDVPYYSQTPSGTFTVTYNQSQDFIGSPSSSWVAKWLNYSATATVPVIFTEPTTTTSSVIHFIVATGYAVNKATTTYTIRDPFYYDTMYLNQNTSTNAHNYSNVFRAAHVFEPTSTTILPLYVEYIIDGAHTLLITDPTGKRLGVDPVTGTSYNEIAQGSEDDSQAGARFLAIYTPVAGKYALMVGGKGRYHLESFVADGRHRPIPQILTGILNSGSTDLYHQNYSPINIQGSTLQQ